MNFKFVALGKIEGILPVNRDFSKKQTVKILFHAAAEALGIVLFQLVAPGKIEGILPLTEILQMAKIHFQRRR